MSLPRCVCVCGDVPVEFLKNTMLVSWWITNFLCSPREGKNHLLFSWTSDAKNVFCPVNFTLS